MSKDLERNIKVTLPYQIFHNYLTTCDRENDMVYQNRRVAKTERGKRIVYLFSGIARIPVMYDVTFEGSRLIRQDRIE